MRQNEYLWSKGLIKPFPNKSFYLYVCSLLKTPWEKEKVLVRAISPFPSVFYLLGELSADFIKLKIVVCKHF